MALELPPLYAILDPEHTRGRPAERVLIGLLEAGVSILQLRVKSLPPVDFLELAKDARTATRAHDCKLIINDRIDIALACDADGVHLGQDDLPLSAGRKLMGKKIVGISTHGAENFPMGFAVEVFGPKNLDHLVNGFVLEQNSAQNRRLCL